MANTASKTSSWMPGTNGKAPTASIESVSALRFHVKHARKAKERQLNYNLLGDVLLSDTGLDTVPEQIRAALHKKRLRVTDLFHQLDDDQSGTISCKEFEKALKEFGLRGPQGGPVDKESVQAVFNSFDPDR